MIETCDECGEACERGRWIEPVPGESGGGEAVTWCEHCGAAYCDGERVPEHDITFF